MNMMTVTKGDIVEVPHLEHSGLLNQTLRLTQEICGGPWMQVKFRLAARPALSWAINFGLALARTPHSMECTCLVRSFSQAKISKSLCFAIRHARRELEFRRLEKKRFWRAKIRDYIFAVLVVDDLRVEKTCKQMMAQLFPR